MLGYIAICWYLHGQSDASGFVDHLVVVEHRLVPRNVQEVQYLGERGPGPQHQLLVVHHQAVFGPDAVAVLIHHADGVVPFLQALPVAVQVEPGDGHLKKPVPKLCFEGVAPGGGRLIAGTHPPVYNRCTGNVHRTPCIRSEN